MPTLAYSIRHTPMRPGNRHYTHNEIDYVALAQWCRTRKGFVQVCENVGATWLPFKPFAVMGRGKKGKKRPTRSQEAIYKSGTASVSMF